MSDLSNVTIENPSEEHIQALLSKLAYVDLTPNFNFDSLSSTENKKFSDAEKNYLKDNFTVLDCSTNYPEYSSGFQGFFFKK